MSKNTYDDIERADNPLQLEEDIPLHIKGWHVQKIVWTIIAVFLLSAAIGLFGTGPLSYRAISKGGNVLQYEQFGRFEGHTELEFNLNKESGITQIGFSQTYLDRFQIERIFPLVEKNQIVNQHIIYTFNATDRGKIRFYLIPQKTGVAKGTITVNSVVFNLSQFIYP
jgi:hypothetical protein